QRAGGAPSADEVGPLRLDRANFLRVRRYALEHRHRLVQLAQAVEGLVFAKHLWQSSVEQVGMDQEEWRLRAFRLHGYQRRVERAPANDIRELLDRRRI